MAGVTYTETVLSDRVVITCTRVRVGGSLDWVIMLETQVLDASGNVIKNVNVDVATLFGVTPLANFKTTLSTGVAQLATNRGINPGT